MQKQKQFIASTSKYYVPIILQEHSLTSRQNSNGFLSEKIDNQNQSPTRKVYKAKSNAQSPIMKRQVKALKPVVFPNILKKTKENIKKLREYQIKQLNDDPLDSNKNENVQKKSKTTKSFKHTKNSSIGQSVPYLKPIYTELSMIANQNQLISSDSEYKFTKLRQLNSENNSPTRNDSIWHITNQVNRVNRVYEIQKEIHHLERFKTQWKTDMISQYLQLKIVLQGLNTKKGLRQVFILIHLPHQNVTLKSSQTEAKTISTSSELSVFNYFVPIYEKIQNISELNENFLEWSKYFLDLLHFKHLVPTAKFFLLDGKRLSTLAQIPSYERLIYVSVDGIFDFWSDLQESLNISGSFLYEKYHKLATKLLDLKQKSDVIKFFSKRENILPYFFKNPNNDSVDDTNEKSSVKSQVEIEDDTIEPSMSMFDQSIHQMNEKEQKSYLKTIQQYINQNKTKYSDRLINLEENMRLRLKQIKEKRIKSIEIKLKQNSIPIQEAEIEHIERKLIYGEELSIDEIKDEAIDQINYHRTAMFKKDKNLEKVKISDPFISLKEDGNQKFKDIVKLVNIEKIVLEKKISRQDVIHYLSLFKALMDSDKPQKVKEMKYPPLFITINQLQKGLAYIALHKNKINTKKLNEAYKKSYHYIDFMEFLDIFTTDFTVSDQEIMDNEQ